MKILYTIYFVSIMMNLIFFTYDMKNLLKSCPYEYKNIAVPVASVIVSFIPIINTTCVLSALNLLFTHNKLLSDVIKWRK
jgi:hypothetical protein